MAHLDTPRPKCRRLVLYGTFAAVALGGTVALALLFFACFDPRWHVWPEHTKKKRFQEIEVTWRPVIEALHQYQAETGQPPESLTELIPTWLDRLPNGWDGPRYGNGRDTAHRIAWYDLGEARKQETPDFPYGPNSRAILAFHLDNSRVYRVELHRHGEFTESTVFDAERWLAQTDERMGMVEDLLARHDFWAVKSREVYKLLGPVDGAESPKPRGWTLTFYFLDSALSWQGWVLNYSSAGGPDGEGGWNWAYG